MYNNITLKSKKGGLKNNNKTNTKLPPPKIKQQPKNPTTAKHRS